MLTHKTLFSRPPRSQRDVLRRIAVLFTFCITINMLPSSSGIAIAQSINQSPLSLPSNQWVVRQVPPFPASIGEPSKHVRMIYDSDRYKVYFWGGDYCVANPVTGSRCASHEEFWSYDVAQDKWELILNQIEANTPGFPRGRCLAGMAYDPKRKVVWMTSGQQRYDSYSPNLYSGIGLWAFDPILRSWSREGPAPDYGESTKVSIPNSFGEYMAYDPVSDALFVPSRTNIQFPLANITLKDGVVQDHWTTSPFSAYDPTMGVISFTVDTRRNRAIVYTPQKGETWSYDFATKQTTRLSTQMLPAKSVFGMVYDSANDVVVLFGGYNDWEGSTNATPLNDLWIFNFGTNTWSKPTIGGSIPSPRKGESIVYDSYNNVILQFGGTGGFQSGLDEYGRNGSELFLLRLNLGQTSSSPSAPPVSPTNLQVQ